MDQINGRAGVVVLCDGLDGLQYGAGDGSIATESDVAGSGNADGLVEL